MKNISPNLFNL